MATTVNPPVACRDENNNVISVEFSGTSDCTDLRIQVADPTTGDVILVGPVSHNGATWTVSFSVAESDFLAGDIACDVEMSVRLTCRDAQPFEVVYSDPPLFITCADCTGCSITIGAVEGLVSGASGLQSLTIDGTATSCSSVKVVAATSGAVAVEKQFAVSEETGAWHAVFTQGDAGVGTNLKDYHCKAIISIEVSCADERHECFVSDSKPIVCRDTPPKDEPDPRDCPDTADVVVTGPGGFSRTNPNDEELECLPAGTYTIQCTTPATAYKWYSDDVAVTGSNSDLQVVSVTGDTMVVSLTGNDNWHFSVTAEISDECRPFRTVAFHCGEPDRNCEVSEWSDWSECRNLRQRRTRTVLVEPTGQGRRCPPLVEGRNCPPVAIDCVPSAWSAFGPCINNQHTRVRTVVTPASNGGRPCVLTETGTCSDIFVDLCLVWMFINFGLMILTAALMVLAGCMVYPVIASGGLLTPALVDLLILLAVFAVVTVVSVGLWMWLCLFGRLRNIMCDLIDFIVFVLAILMALSGVLMVVLGFIKNGCALGAAAAIVWFTAFNQLFYWTGVLMGCTTPFDLFGAASGMKKRMTARKPKSRDRTGRH